VCENLPGKKLTERQNQKKTFRDKKQLPCALVGGGSMKKKKGYNMKLLKANLDKTKRLSF